jgi:hypothetical protein
MITKTVQVTFRVNVTVDETKFTEDFLTEFTESFFPFQNIDDHIKHLAQLAAREFIDGPSTFIEGYGVASEMGISVDIEDEEEEIL